MEQLTNLIERITAPDEAVGIKAQERLDNLTKPQGSLGRLEEIARALCVMKGVTTLTQPKPAVAVFAADHGVALAGVSPFPREVTAQMIYNFLNGGAGINVLARLAGAPVRVVDVGVDADLPGAEGLVRAKVMKGTRNLLEEPAMTRDEAVQAIMAGAAVAEELIAEGHDLLIPGDMGIGNTTPSACLAAAFTGLTPAQVTGRGAGLDDEGLARKVAYVEQALKLHQPADKPPLEVIAALGGLEIAAIAGYCLAAAANKTPVILDGMISTAGGISAFMLCPQVASYYLAGHGSVEIGQRTMLDKMGLRHLLDLSLRLGEGTGAAVAVHIVRAAVAMYSEMLTFAEAGVSVA